MTRADWYRRLVGLLLVALSASVAVALLPPGRTGNLYVTNNAGDDITVYDPNGDYERSFTAAGLNGPRGIVFTGSGEFYVASQLTNEIFHFGADEQVLGKFGAAELVSPTGMAINNDGTELFVGSFNNDQVVVFSLDGTYLRTFTGGSLNGPNCVAFDPAGNVYVSSASTGDVLKFDPDENFLFEFTGGGLASPMSIARNTSGVLYVSGGASSNIVKFDTAGNFLGVLTHPDLPAPQGIAFDDRGHFFISSFSLPNIVEFDDSDGYVQTITGPELDVPRSLAMRPLPSAIPAVPSWGLLALATLMLSSGALLVYRRGSL